ncbi:heterokaryon incompatibility protein-domain-containing protein, partial [Dendryphion nanum]
MVLRLRPIPNRIPGVFEGPGLPYILSRSKKGSPLQPLRDCIDFSIAENWLRLCSTQHSNCYKRQALLIPLRLIDCIERTIISPQEGVDYVTLSYVWGSTVANSNEQNGSSVNQALPTSLPQTIEDAMTVTKKLNYRYLWIDKYCVPSDPEIFLNQIQQMDLIYRNSVLTIVDASGKDPTTGLPGVRAGSRIAQQPCVHFQGHELISSMPRPEWTIKSSPWSTRAWTYQEGLLSCRRLFFTSQQLYFECQGIYCSEALDFPIEGLLKIHTRDRQHLRDDLCLGGRIGLYPITLVDQNSWEIFAHLSAYSQRTLTYEADILNGILGLFRHTEALANPIRHIWGLPFQEHQSWDDVYVESTYRQLSFVESMSWTLKKPSSRRPGFPSWSWVGWYGG